MTEETRREKRVKSIQALQKERNSTIICYITGDRPSFGIGIPSLATQIGSDIIRYIRDILEEIRTQEKIDLFLYSRGGEITAPSPIVHLIRKHCKKFCLLIPYRAHSAANSNFSLVEMK